jgi:uroporphyrinogen decarboxylase
LADHSALLKLKTGHRERLFMNSREMIFKTLKERKITGRVPWSFNFGASQGFNPTLLKNFKKYEGVSGPLCEHFDYDVFPVLDPDGDESKFGLDALASGINYLDNRIRIEDYFDTEELPDNGYLDAWGIYHYPWELDNTFEVYISPLKGVSDIGVIKKFPTPKVDMESLEEARMDIERIKREKQKMTVSYAGSLYEWSKDIRGEEVFFMDLHDNPEIIRALIEKVAGFTLTLASKLQEAGLDILSFYDDFGAQDRLQIDPVQWRKYVKPGWKKIWEKVRKNNPNTIIFLHSCGCIEEVIPDLIEIGLDVLHPIQPETMDVYKIAENYQKDLAIWGTISSQRTIPFGTPGEIEAEIKDRVKKIGKKGGFIISPANIMGPEVPIKNIKAFHKACQKYCYI